MALVKIGTARLVKGIEVVYMCVNLVPALLSRGRQDIEIENFPVVSANPFVVSGIQR